MGPEDGKLLVPLALGLQLVGVGTTAASAALANGRSRAASRNRAFLVLITAGQVALFAALEFLMGRCVWVILPEALPVLLKGEVYSCCLRHTSLLQWLCGCLASTPSCFSPNCTLTNMPSALPPLQPAPGTVVVAYCVASPAFAPATSLRPGQA